MTLTPEQKVSVSEWVAAGDNLYAVQKKLAEHFKVSMTYMDVRFLVDDLNLQIKDPAPKADASDVSKSPPKPEPAAPPAGDIADAVPSQDLPHAASGVNVTVDKISLNP